MAASIFSEPGLLARYREGLRKRGARPWMINEALAAGSVLFVQGSLTLAGALFGSFMSEPMTLAMTSTWRVLLLGLGLKEVRVADMLPALVVAPLIVAAAPLWPLWRL